MPTHIQINKIAHALGAEISGIDLRQPLTDEIFEELHAALCEHFVIFFRDQNLTPAQHKQFALRFGALQTHPAYPTVEGFPEITILENDKDNPSKIEKWHIDMTFRKRPPLGSILHAKSVPAVGGDTMWASMYAAYKGLSDAMQHFLSGLTAIHDFAFGFQESLAEPGGGSGIGFTIAKEFLETGAHIIIASRDEERLKKACDELSAFGSCRYLVLDIRETEQIKSLFENIAEHEGRLDILINNAGGQFPSSAEDISVNGWNAVINNNLNGTWFVTQQAAKQFFLQQKNGIIVNIIANIFRGFPGMAHTGAARAGVSNLTKTLAVEWAHKNVRINVNGFTSDIFGHIACKK